MGVEANDWLEDDEGWGGSHLHFVHVSQPFVTKVSDQLVTVTSDNKKRGVRIFHPFFRLQSGF